MGGGENFSNVAIKSIEKGDSCNTSHWAFSNHLGTHIDFPKHFFADGKTLHQYCLDELIFSDPYVVDISPTPAATLIDEQRLPIGSVPHKTDFLLIKTGFCGKRDAAVYWKNNPGLVPGVAAALRQSLPNLRCIGFDLISLSSFAHRSIGRYAHQSFLAQPRPILLIEDMDLRSIDCETRLNKVIVAPLRVKGADAAPCTVLAEKRTT